MTRFGYTGRERDALTGLQQYRARWYDPQQGRFISEDPSGFKSGPNLYEYVRNNPVNLRDPQGLDWGKADFMQHYWTGMGSPIDLAGVGLLDDFQNASSVQEKVSEFRLRALRTAQDKARGLCKYCNDGRTRGDFFDFSDTASTSVRNEGGGIFVVGRSTLNRYFLCSIYANCSSKSFSFSCDLLFSIYDSFTDPLDGEKVGFPFDIPTATPYPITASWTVRFSGNSRF